MLIKDIGNCEEFIAGDNVIMYELLHPDKADLKIHYSLAHGKVRPGEISLPHILRTSEVYYITEGKGVMYIDEETANVCAGQAIYVPPLAKQRIRNNGEKDLKFLCIVDPAWRPEDEEVLQ